MNLVVQRTSCAILLFAASLGCNGLERGSACEEDSECAGGLECNFCDTSVYGRGARVCMDGLGDYGACDIGLDRVGSVREPPRDAGSSHPRSANVGSQSKSYCGDGVCDPQTERSYAHGPNTGRLNDHACEADCGSYTCGNRVIEGPEECDDGNTRSDDGCSTYCKLETLGSPPTAPAETSPHIAPKISVKTACSRTT